MSFYAKSVSFWPNEWIFKYSDKIMFFLTSIFVQKCQFWEKKLNFVRNLIFSNNCALLLKVNILLENMLIFRKLWLFVWLSIYIKKLSISENCYFDSKVWFYSVIFWKKCHFPSKIYISGGINFLEKSSNFLRKGVNLAVNFGKNGNWY